MKFVEIDWNPPERQLRQFGCIAALVLPVVGWARGANPMVIGLLALAGAAMAGFGWFRPLALKPVFLALMIVAIPIGMVVGELAMLLIYFGVFLPIGLVFRLSNRDNLQLTLDRNAATYWQPKKQPDSPAAYYRQF